MTGEFKAEDYPFGRYAGELHRLRTYWEGVHQGIYLTYGAEYPVGKPVYGVDPAGFGHIVTIGLHPTDYIWWLLGDIDWQAAHTLSMNWQKWRINQLAKIAEGKINRPTPKEIEEFEELERIRENQWGHVRGMGLGFRGPALGGGLFGPVFPNNKTTLRV